MLSTVSAWAELLAAWAIPPAILDAAPESPWGFDVAMFARRAAEADPHSPSARLARQALPDGGSLLDVGCGGGAAAFVLVPPAGRVTGVDESGGMLAAFGDRAAAVGVDCELLEGRWPDIAGRTPVADVAVCWHVFHNVPDVGAFALALDGHARHRVVVELSATHPLTWTTPYWRRFHGLDRPDGPTDADAVEALSEAGIDVALTSWDAPSFLATADPDEAVRFLRRRLCLPAERDGDIRAAIGELGLPRTRRLTALWWTPSSEEGRPHGVR